MRPKTYRYMIGDFETTVYKGQEATEVWASAIVDMYAEDVKIHNSIAETFNYIVSLKENVCIYYHNLKFDGNFWLSYLLKDLEYKQALEQKSVKELDVSFLADSDMKNKTFKYSISDMGQWYTITIKVNGKIIQLRDSFKLLPFSLSRIGKAFKTKHQKLEMEYEGFRYSGCEITEKEREYIKNDVLVIKEALEFMFKEGHTDLTIGACCLSEFKRIIGKDDYALLFPDLYAMPLDELIYKYANAGEYVKRSYKGGWCYLVRGKEGQILHNGSTFDVNSLYPSMMSSESGNRYPIGKPTFWHGDYIPEVAKENDKYYFITIRTRFYIKHNKLPCIQIKGNLSYPPNEWLDTSDIKSWKNGKRYKEYKDFDGTIKPAVVTLTLTMTDFQLIKDHYELVDFEIMHGCWFYTAVGIFDKYIEKYKKIKLESTGAMRELAKLFLNNLYGKMASSQNSSFKLAYLKENNVVGFTQVQEANKRAGYIPIGSAITSYARNFTIRAAQKNYHGVDKAGFVYGDTDSIHCDLPPEEVKGIEIHDKNFCCWKPESNWDEAIFTRQKTYIEHITHEELHEIKPFYSVKCAGMPERCKHLFLKSMEGISKDDWATLHSEEWHSMSDEAKAFVVEKRGLEDFKVGLSVPEKLMPKRILGGVLLVNTTFEMR